MKIDYASDIHLDFYVPFNHNQIRWEQLTREFTKKLVLDGEVLIIAGDVSHWNIQTVWFLDELSKAYEKVLFVYGNHDLYLVSKNQRKKYRNSMNRLAELLALVEEIDNVYFMQGSIVEHKGVTFAGDPLWYNLKTDKHIHWFNEFSNDSLLIIPEDYVDAHTYSQQLWKEALYRHEKLENKHVDVMISHIPPLQPKISSYDYNEAYVAPVPFLIGRHWVCGHQHIEGTFKANGVSFHMNAIGYPNERLDIAFKQFVLENS